MLHIKKNSMLLIVALICFGILGDLFAGSSKPKAKTTKSTTTTTKTTTTNKAKEEEEKRLADLKAQEEKEKAEADEKKRKEQEEIVRIKANSNPETYSKYLTSLYDSVKTEDNLA